MVADVTAGTAFLETVVGSVGQTQDPTGGPVMTEFKIDMPSAYLITDHSLSRLFKGAVGEIVATGPPNPEIYGPVE